MNILFFLSPKQDLMYVYDDFTLRQTLEKWENNRYASIPILNRRGEYVGTLTEGTSCGGSNGITGWIWRGPRTSPSAALSASGIICPSPSTPAWTSWWRRHEPELWSRWWMTGVWFIGIVRRQAIIKYCYDKSRRAESSGRRTQSSAPVLAAAQNWKTDLFRSAPAGERFLLQKAQKTFQSTNYRTLFLLSCLWGGEEGGKKGPSIDIRIGGETEYERI